MKTSLTGIQKVLSVMHRHAALIEEAFKGPISGGDRQREAAITELAAVGALKPYDEGTYFLTSGLHDYFSVHLSSYHAFQALTRITSLHQQANRQWDEIWKLKQSGAHKDARKLELAFHRSIIEIRELMERNIGLLNSMVLGQYGNVENLSSKLRQNSYYTREVQTCLAELLLIEKFVNRIADDTIVRGMLDIGRIVQRRLGSQLLPWSSMLKDAQAEMSKRLFHAKLMERRQQQLAKYGSWLAGNKGTDGWDIEIDDTFDQTLLPPSMLGFRPQPYFGETSSANVQRMVEISHRLPKQEERPNIVTERGDTTAVLADEMVEIEEELEPHEEALRLLKEHLEAFKKEVSLVQWREQSKDLQDLDDEIWLFYVITQLPSSEYDIRYLTDNAGETMPINEPFYDIAVRVAEAA